ncbi:MAG: 2-phosphosulfolactate phosphatase [Candidatus Bathyarchaeota archaeon]|nr:2-phosphosulfolactate phosphatase [Candidatus Bathyarchaeota archaeon]
MRIKRLSLIEGSKRAEGLAVVIDVFRAFTTAAYVMANGADRIHPVGSLEEVFSLREKNPDWVLMGERGGNRVEGFDYGNSPYEVRDIDFTGKTVVQSTSAGTQGIVNAKDADEVLPGSFVMADAIARYIQGRNPEVVSLVAMGWGGKARSVEDEALADYLEARLRGWKTDFKELKHRIRINPQGDKFFDPAQPNFVEGDFHCAMDLNRFDFCLRVVRDKLPFFERV